MSIDDYQSHETAINTDVELWRETPGDYYANAIFRTKGGAVGIDVGGLVYVKTLAAWHAMAVQKDPPPRLGEKRKRRVSSVRGDPGYDPKASNQNIRILLDGVDVTDLGVITADEIAGYILAYSPLPAARGGTVGLDMGQTEIHYGVVQIVDEKPEPNIAPWSVRAVRAERALRAISKIDPLKFISRGDAADQGSAHLGEIYKIVREALANVADGEAESGS